MRWLVALAVILGLSAPAIAGDRIARGAPAEWVDVQTVMSPTETLGEAPVRQLLNDEQIRIDGVTKHIYWHFAMLLQTPDGLSAGNINFPWRPDVDQVTVHMLRIRRGDQTIDVLDSQDFVVVRREPNMEQAMLDGVLTASIQPEGLQVGDIIEFAGTISTTDPVFAGNNEYINFSWNPAPIDRARIRASWPRRQAIRYQIEGDFAPPVVTNREGWTSVELNGSDIEPIAGPRGAPGRYQTGRVFSMSSFDSWSAISRLMAPHYEQAARLSADSPLRREIERIAAASSDPVTRTEAALVLVEERVRYVALLSGLGGLIPASADESWSRRFGDCKGKTVLLLAILGELGIEAEAVLVNSGSIDGIDRQLPQIGMFNHVIVRARIDGRDYWLDGTRTGDRRLSSLPVPNYFVGLPVRAGGSELIAIVPPPLEVPAETLVIAYDGSGGVTARMPVEARMEFVGDGAIGMNMALAGMTSTQRTTGMEAFWRSRLQDLEIASVDFSYDAAMPKATLSVRGTALIEWVRRGWRPTGTQMGYTPDFTRNPGPDQDAPFAVAHPIFGRTEVSLILPAGVGSFRIQGEPLVERRVAGLEYIRTARIADNRFHMVNSQRSIAREFPAADAVAAATELRALTNKDLVLVAPAGALAVAIDAASDETSDYSALLARAESHASAENYAASIADLSRALPLAPVEMQRDIRLQRAAVYLSSGDHDSAERDIDQVLAAHPDYQIALLMQGQFRLDRGKAREAIDSFTRLLEIDIRSTDALNGRSAAYRLLGNHARALADIDASLAISREQPEAFLQRANILRRLQRHADVLRVADDVVSANPNSGYAWVISARILERVGERDRALAALDRALAIEPEGYVYLNRAFVRPSSDYAARMADIEQALTLDPSQTDGWILKSTLQMAAGDAAGAAASLSVALEADATSAELLNQRGIALTRAGRDEEALADFTAARSAAVDANALNSLCWEKTMAGVALERALAECNAALAMAPDSANIIDSRGWTYVRLGRHREAISDFDRALALDPDLEGSLYGRAMARQALGDRAGARADRDAAFALSADVDSEFRDAGIVLTLD